VSDINIRIKDDWVLFAFTFVVVGCLLLFGLWRSEHAEVERMLGVVKQYESERQLIDSVVGTFQCQRNHICKRPHVIEVRSRDVSP